MLSRIHHIELIVADLDSTVDFFKQLGFQEMRRTHHHDISVELKLPDEETMWEIHQVAEGEVVGINHIGFEVDDVVETHKELVEKGISFQRDVYTYDIDDVYGNSWRVADLRDPSGFRYHILDTKGERTGDEPSSLDTY